MLICKETPAVIDKLYQRSIATEAASAAPMDPLKRRAMRAWPKQRCSNAERKPQGTVAGRFCSDALLPVPERAGLPLSFAPGRLHQVNGAASLAQSFPTPARHVPGQRGRAQQQCGGEEEWRPGQVPALARRD